MNTQNETRNDMRSATTLDHYYNPCEGLDGETCENTASRALLLPGHANWSWLCLHCASRAEEQAAERQTAYLARRRQEHGARHGNGGNAA